ncbi:metal-sensitive transcriptional regulator [Microbacterium sp. EST19A]|uniref:metal-sensitive transcriptional regulator n=1 Tax=Microbacterium sp. EST19A TaxID=2862681 RepID=UPI001CBAF519|nr:metal-sensitive transcriptional regulator [Microbacterium sp. EST19A]
MNGHTDGKTDLRKRVSRVAGQLREIARMVDEDKYFIDTLRQVSAATRALRTVALSPLSDHLSHCVAEASAEGGAVAAEKVREPNAAISRLVRS